MSLLGHVHVSTDGCGGQTPVSGSLGLELNVLVGTKPGLSAEAKHALNCLATSPQINVFVSASWITEFLWEKKRMTKLYA